MSHPATPYSEIDFEDDYARMIPGIHAERPRPKPNVVRLDHHSAVKAKPFRSYWKGLQEKSGFRIPPRRVLILGAGATGRSLARALRREGTAEVCGFLDDRHLHAPEVLGKVDDLARIARAEFIDEIIVALPSHSNGAWEACEVAQRNHLDIRMTVALPGGTWPHAVVDRIGEVPVISLHREPFPRAMLLLKRLVDVAGALVGLGLAWLVMAIVALAIRFDTPGPAIYAAERIGAKGRPFRCYKFRSMVENAEGLQESLRCRNQRQGPIFKINSDPRITRVGRFIRRYSLDELPQLWNVLRGDMSLVGPRPHPIEDVSRYELHDYRRLDVKPGLTGLWQVTARKNPSFKLSMHLDLTYIENWTLLLDLRILLRTLRVLFCPEGV